VTYSASIDPKISPGGDASGVGGQTAPLNTLGAWSKLPFFRDVWPELSDQIAKENRRVLPPPPLRFAALARTQPEDTKVIILGQDPYPTEGHANGLAFSVAPEVALPRSLKNIFRELEDDLGQAPANGNLSPWADQGVLLLNTALTVPEGEAGGHAKMGWSRLTEQVLAHLDATPRAFLLWGKHAQKLGANLSDHHLKIETAHPSPLSARRGFFGARPFSRTNTWLEANGQTPIRWV